MAKFVFNLPDVGEGVAEAEIVAWHVAVGDVIAEDQPIADVMTDKATVEVPSPTAGVVKELKAKEGDVITVGQVLIVVDADGGAATAAAATKTGSERRSHMVGCCLHSIETYHRQGILRPTCNLPDAVASYRL